MIQNIKRAYHIFFETSTDWKTSNKEQLKIDIYIVEKAKEAFLLLAVIAAVGSIYSFAVSATLPLILCGAVFFISLLIIKQFDNIAKEMQKLELLLEKKPEKEPENVLEENQKRLEENRKQLEERKAKVEALRKENVEKAKELEALRKKKLEEGPPQTPPQTPPRPKPVLERSKTDTTDLTEPKTPPASSRIQRLQRAVTEANLTLPSKHVEVPQPLAPARKDVRRKLERQLTGADNEDAQLQTCLAEYNRDPASLEALRAFCELVDKNEDFAAKEFAKLKQTGRFPFSKEFLIACLDHTTPKGTYVILTLNDLEPLETFPALLALYRDNREYRELLFPKTEKFLQELFEDTHFEVHHFNSLIEIVYEADRLSNDPGKTQSAYMVSLYGLFKLHPRLITAFIQDQRALYLHHYLLGWVVNAELPLDGPCIQMAFTECKEAKEPTQFLNCYIKENQGQIKAKNVDEFRAKVVQFLLLDYLEKRKSHLGPHTPIDHCRILGIIAHLYRDPKILGPDAINHLAVALLDQAVGDKKLIIVFVRLLDIFYGGDTDRQLQDPIFIPLRRALFDYFESSSELQQWALRLNTVNRNESDLKMYLINVLLHSRFPLGERHVNTTPRLFFDAVSQEAAEKEAKRKKARDAVKK